MKPRAAPPYFPYRDHRDMATVMADEERQREADRQAYNRERKALTPYVRRG